MKKALRESLYNIGKAIGYMKLGYDEISRPDWSIIPAPPLSREEIESYDN